MSCTLVPAAEIVHRWGIYLYASLCSRFNTYHVQVHEHLSSWISCEYRMLNQSSTVLQSADLFPAAEYPVTCHTTCAPSSCTTVGPEHCYEREAIAHRKTASKQGSRNLFHSVGVACHCAESKVVAVQTPAGNLKGTIQHHRHVLALAIGHQTYQHRANSQILHGTSMTTGIASSPSVPTCVCNGY